jgi:hypothetical protein
LNGVRASLWTNSAYHFCSLCMRVGEMQIEGNCVR